MTNVIYVGDCIERLRQLPDQSVNTCVTSPPYWGLRDYGVCGQIGAERTPDAFVGRLVDVFREVRRVLRDDGTLWLNLGDCFATRGSGRQGASGQRNGRRFTAESAGGLDHGLKVKDLVGIPWLVAFALRSDGWYLRSDIVWHKPNPIPESVRDRPTRSHEYIFLLTKNDMYYYDADAIKEPAKYAGRVVKTNGSDGMLGGGEVYRTRDGIRRGIVVGDKRNKRTVWTVPTRPFSGAHFATFPPDLIEPCVLAGSPEGGSVLDPFFGAGTTGLVALRNRRKFVGIELNPEYAEIAKDRIDAEFPDEATVVYETKGVA